MVIRIMVSDFSTSLTVATSKIPGSLITGFVSVFLAVLIYEPVYLGVKNISIFKDNTYESEDTEEEAIENDNLEINHNNI